MIVTNAETLDTAMTQEVEELTSFAKTKTAKTMILFSTEQALQQIKQEKLGAFMVGALEHGACHDDGKYCSE